MILDDTPDTPTTLPNTPPPAEERTPADVLVGIGEAARIAGVAPITIRRWCDTGRIPHSYTAGGHRRIPVHALTAEPAELDRLPAKKTAPNRVIPALSRIADDWVNWAPTDRISDDTLAQIADAIDGGSIGTGLLGDLARIAEQCRNELARRDQHAPPNTFVAASSDWAPRQT